MDVYRTTVFSLVVMLVVGVAGCSTYYKIHDPSTGKDYYTEDYDKNRDGSVAFIDGATGSEVTIQNSEVMEIESDVFEENIEAE